MHPILAQLAAGLDLSGDVALAVPLLLRRHGHPKTVEHSRAVAEECRLLATRFDLDPRAAEQAGWLHDVSAVWSPDQRLAAALALDLPVLPAEREHPLLLHQRLSAVLAAQLFAVSDPAVLSAIACHTTLRAGPAPLDLLLFVADKLAWDQPGSPPFSAAMRTALDDSLPAAARVYLRYLWQRRDTLPAVHPWLIEAWESFKIEE